MPKVFISYSHDSSEHAERVLVLADRLIQDGLDCILDQYEGDPSEGWPQWIDRKIKEADIVLMVCTETYYKRVMGEEEIGKGLGAKWEGRLIYQHIYQAEAENTKFIPVLFEAGKVEYIPTPLQGGGLPTRFGKRLRMALLEIDRPIQDHKTRTWSVTKATTKDKERNSLKKHREKGGTILKEMSIFFLKKSYD